MTPTRSLRQTTLCGMLLLLCSCSRSIINPSSVNRDAAARCVRNIDAWKKDLARLDLLREEFDLTADQIRREYATDTPEAKMRLRARLADVITETDQMDHDTDALFREIIRDLEYVSRDKRTRARIAEVTNPLRDAEYIRGPEIQYAMDAVSSQLQTLLQVD
ncbi:MAG TPA: hypothetical protein VMV72_10950 [Verrucomicrobiae bacterium]|nr:hypothetical protein [Verrucomicrobiae bacterium]